MATENDFRNIVASIAINRLKKRGARQGTIDWTVGYRKELAAAEKEFGRGLRDLANAQQQSQSAEFKGVPAKSGGAEVLPFRRELLKAFRELHNDEGPEAA